MTDSSETRNRWRPMLEQLIGLYRVLGC
jgi:hypothetical protein